MKKILFKTIALVLFLFFVFNSIVYAEETTTTGTDNKKVEELVSVTVSGIGDCTLGSDFRSSPVNSFMSTFEKNKKNYDYFFLKVRDILKKDDLTIANLEGPLTNATEGMEKEFQFKGLPEFTNILKSGSVEAVTVANNHSHDYFEVGHKDTVTALKKAKIGYCGYGNKVIKNLKGIKFGLLGYKVWKDNKDSKAAIKKDIKKLRASGAQIVIVSFHWGEESKNYPNATQTIFGRYTIDSGADLVLGHHSHVMQSIEQYKGKYIVYSLGNFCTGGNRNPSDKDTFIFQQKFNFKNGKQVHGSANVIPCSVSSVKDRNNFQPIPLTGKDRERVINRLNTYSKDYHFKIKL